MLPLKVLVTLLALACSPFTAGCPSRLNKACPSPQHKAFPQPKPGQQSEGGSQNHKRWFSLPTAQDVMPGNRRPWPPSASGGNSPITYCFVDQAALSLRGILEDAIDNWTPAMHASSLAIIPDPACVGPTEHACMCSVAAVSLRSLRISLGQVSAASVGYKDVGDYNVLYLAINGNRAQDVLSMTHELGHAIGLDHEHQRPDADHYVDFAYEELGGYDEAREKVAAASDADLDVPHDATIEERFHKVANSQGLAKKYFEGALHWMPLKHATSRAFSEYFDFESIMIYDSLGHTENGRQYFPLVKRAEYLSHGRPTDPVNQIYMGGNSNKALAGPSYMDIERVAALYPKAPQTTGPRTGLATGRRNIGRGSESTNSSSASGCTLPQPISSASQAHKRWVSINPKRGAKRAWPLSKETGQRLVTYCFSNEVSLSTLGPMFSEAIKKWDDAITASSLVITPDPACKGSEDRCLCSVGGVSRMSCQVELGESTSTSVGSVDFVEDPDSGRKRSNLIFNPTPNKDRPVKDWNYDVLRMTHEIGHLIGFYHEHQRPDADKYICFNCEALRGYEEAKAKAVAAKHSDYRFSRRASIDEKMKTV